MIDLRNAGFTVFMDDFGSGYSSLNMLKDVNVDVIKIDTKFLDMNEHSQNRGMGNPGDHCPHGKADAAAGDRGGSGEKGACGFPEKCGLYLRPGLLLLPPMPIEQFEPPLLDEENVDYRGILAHQLEELRLEDLVNKDVTSDAILNNMLGGDGPLRCLRR